MNLKRVYSLRSLAIPLALGLFIGSLATSAVYKRREQQSLSQISPIRQSDAQHKLISPLLAYNLPEKIFGENKKFESDITDKIVTEKSQGKVNQVSIYYHSFSSGDWVGVDENSTYYPASMMKVVIMIAYYKEAESNPGILQQKLAYTKDVQNEIKDTSEFEAPSSLQVNQQYSIDDLISSMIINSDNGAAFTLLNNLDNDSLNEVYSDLGIPVPNANQDYLISAKNYALFLRVLYNSTYLTRDYSEKALELLSSAQYKDGLVAGVSSDVKVAHKFGEHVLSTNGTQTGVELNDCGIIYKPDSPYLLCIMTEGNNIDGVTQTIKDISQLVFQNTK